MNTFLNIASEFPLSMLTEQGHYERARVISHAQKNDLNTRINMRGVREQYNAILCSHYDERYHVRLTRGTSLKGNRLICKYA